MNQTHLHDQLSFWKNLYLGRVAAGFPTFWTVCGERTSQPFREDRHRYLRDETRWSAFPAFTRLKALPVEVEVSDSQIWHRLIPGLVGVNAEELPARRKDRRAYLGRLLNSVKAAKARLLFLDLSTGIASGIMNRGAESVRSQLHLYDDEIALLFDEFPGTLLLYQHSRHQYYPNDRWGLIEEYPRALQGWSYLSSMVALGPQTESGPASVVQFFHSADAELKKTLGNMAEDMKKDIRRRHCVQGKILIRSAVI